MFGGFTNPPKDKVDPLSSASATGVATASKNSIEDPVSSRDDKVVSLVESPKRTGDKWNQIAEKKKKKRRSSSTAKAAALFASAKNTLHLSSSKDSAKEDLAVETPIQALGKMDPALNVPQGSLNNSAGESLPTSRSTFRVGVTEDKNKKCRRTMEDTHAYLYHFLGTPIALKQTDQPSQTDQQSGEPVASIEAPEGPTQIAETDNGYFAIFDGHAGTFAAEWCGKKLHLILEESIRKNPKAPVPMLLDHTFTAVDQQLESLPVRNSGCTAVTAVLRWEDRTASSMPPPIENASKKSPDSDPERESISKVSSPESLNVSRQDSVSNSEDPSITTRSRVLYTANVGDARIILCRNGKALRLSYDHKGSDENEGIRITNAGGLILNNRVNGVLAVTRALGDSYMKDLVTGHPFTTETIIQPETDEFLILACDGLWDVCSDQEAVDLVRDTQDPQSASKILVDHALSRFSTDNLSCMIVRFDKQAISDRNSKPAEPNPEQATTGTTVISETENIVEIAKKTTEKEPRDSLESDNNQDISPAEDTAQADSKSDQELGPEISSPGESKNLAVVSESNVQENASPASGGKKPNSE